MTGQQLTLEACGIWKL